ncbi:hypothetical protein [Gelidibacter maritimus]|uniref:Uncharacterized protein n=1 Tax=Gelidibacter maritimus TaxID=2761487 RepID=A0A7W2M2J1_9FLAO|nr:hypothetical protein [Gelidibacter maritimus]MBA6151515.1 hypothetical protein [Gelidibacter maritimus]
MRTTFIITAILFTLVTNAQSYIREGKGDYNNVLYTWDGKYLRQGKGNYGTVVFTMAWKYIRQGM